MQLQSVGRASLLWNRKNQLIIIQLKKNTVSIRIVADYKRFQFVTTK